MTYSIVEKMYENAVNWPATANIML